MYEELGNESLRRGDIYINPNKKIWSVDYDSDYYEYTDAPKSAGYVYYRPVAVRAKNESVHSTIRK